MSVEEAVIARLSRNGMHFELLVYPEACLEFRKGRAPLDKALAVSEVFRDARKGDRASEEELVKAFQTRDFRKAAEAIILKGDVQLTTEQRRRMTEERRKEVAYMISRQGINPQTKMPHPQARILSAMDQARAMVDPFRPAGEQVEATLDRIRDILPISFERLEVAIRIPVQFAGKAGQVVRGMAAVKKEEWSATHWTAVVEIPAGMQADMYARLNDVSGGKAESRILREIPI
jgi:ribosome maturation protein SDO1